VFAVQHEPIDVASWARLLEDHGAGAVVVFEGRVRDRADGRPVEGLTYEAHETLALKEGERILAEALQRFAIQRAAAVHRVGPLAIGECAVWVGVAAEHRSAAFSACSFVIDEIKARVPIWKHERYSTGEAAWVEGQRPRPGEV